MEETLVFCYKIVLQQLADGNKGNVKLKEYRKVLEWSSWGLYLFQSLQDAASVAGNECKVSCENVPGGGDSPEGFEYEY
jgi:hypothetical protein